MSKRTRREDARGRRERRERHTGAEREPGGLPPGATHIMLPRQLFEGVPEERARAMMREVFPDVPELSPEEFMELAKDLPTIEFQIGPDVRRRRGD